jgi:hypothetical protein
MSDFYGRWLTEDHQNEVLHSHEKYHSRVTYFTSLAEKTIDDICKKYPELNGKIFVCYQNIEIALGRYFNDIYRYKVLHKIQKVHPSKMVAHTIKWIHLNPILFSSIQKKDFKSLPEIEKGIATNINYSFIIQSVEYMLRAFNPSISEAKYDHVFYNLQYFLKTGSYQERMASLWFEELIKG